MVKKNKKLDYWDSKTENSIKYGWKVLRWLRSFDYPNPPEEAAIKALYDLLVDSERIYRESKKSK
jgi:hypothetical protein